MPVCTGLRMQEKPRLADEQGSVLTLQALRAGTWQHIGCCTALRTWYSQE